MPTVSREIKASPTPKMTEMRMRNRSSEKPETNPINIEQTIARVGANYWLSV